MDIHAKWSKIYQIDFGVMNYMRISHLKKKTNIIKTKLLTSDRVKSAAFKNDKAVETVKCPKGMIGTYQKILSKKGLGKKVKWK